MRTPESGRTRATHYTVLLLTAILAIHTAIIVFGCSEENGGTRIANRHPIVVIKGGPLQGSTASYNAQILWSGWDEDGVVTHYEYAVDPPAAFSQWEIAYPERFPYIRIEVIGPAPVNRPVPGQDTLLVSKVVDGDTVSFRWVETHEFSRTFSFQTPNPDSQFVGGGIEPLDRYSGSHVVYVRCQDNDGAFSDTDPSTGGDTLEADYIGYTATTQTPSSHLVLPAVHSEVATLGPTLYAEWDGIDPDAPGFDKVPKGYLYNLLRVDRLQPPVPILHASPDLLNRFGHWTYQSADTLTAKMELAVPGEYIFGIRAVDEPGAIEPVLQLGRNVIRFQALSKGGKPTLCIQEPDFAPICFRGIGEAQEAQVPTNRVLYFTWQGIPDPVVGPIQAYSWGLDLADLSVEGPGSGWSSWGPSQSPVPAIKFSQPGIHVLYVRVKDVSESITLATLVLHVIEFTFDKEALLVDDYLDNLDPRDSEHDAFWQDMLANSGVPLDQFSEFASFGQNDRGSLFPIKPDLSQLAPYKLIIWDNAAWGYNFTSALFHATVEFPLLSSYLRAGGNLWITGSLTVAATTVDTTSHTYSDLVYPKTLRPGDWAWDFLKLHSSRINNDKGNNKQNLLHSVKPFPGVPNIYTSMVVDTTKLTLFERTNGGLRFADAIFDPMYAESEPGFRGDIDTLYAYGASGPEYQNRFSPYHNKPCALRWHDPDPAREQGRVQWFGFELYYFQNSQAAQVFKESLDWMREEEPPRQ